MNVLIVDDQKENRKLLKEIIGSYGMCDLVGNGADLVFLDIMMPKMDGHEVLKKMRMIERENGVFGQDESVIIMVTAVDSPRSVLDAFSRGLCTDYLAKPVSREMIFGKMREYQLID